MLKPGTDESNVQMNDVLCDYCHREWSAEVPFIEGHRGAVICGRCLSMAYFELDHNGPNVVSEGYFCRMSRESDDDRAALNRTGEPGWRSPIDPEAAISRMCVRLAAGALEKDPDFDWTRPDGASDESTEL